MNLVGFVNVLINIPAMIVSLTLVCIRCQFNETYLKRLFFSFFVVVFPETEYKCLSQIPPTKMLLKIYF